ncbi:MAG: methyl-accepting chemotaxis protein, partial [Pseudomonadales bacterium]|nr:methyl-accepting chemotaxis protein [Pseudomonadales bacterium]
VADEVRALASRTQSSTEEIQEMIGVLQSSADNAFTNMQRGKHSAENAVELSMQARSSLEEITDAIGHMADMNTQIAAAAEEQSAVSNELSANANNLSMFSRDSCDLSENVNSAAEAMNRMASELRQKLANFKV